MPNINPRKLTDMAETKRVSGNVFSFLRIRKRQNESLAEFQPLLFDEDIAEHGSREAARLAVFKPKNNDHPSVKMACVVAAELDKAREDNDTDRSDRLMKQLHDCLREADRAMATTMSEQFKMIITAAKLRAKQGEPDALDIQTVEQAHEQLRANGFTEAAIQREMGEHYIPPADEADA